MSLHYPSVLQKRVRTLIVPQIDTLASIPYDISRTGIHSRSIPYELLQICNIIRGHCARSSVSRFLFSSEMRVLRTRTPLWIRQIHRDTLRHAHLVQLQIGITRDNRTRRKVHTFPHEVSAQTAFFAFESGTDGLDRSAGFLECLWDTCDIVVHIRCYVELDGRLAYVCARKEV